ncbi:3270_t:CDS:2 [Entrophospora sp. SA101]|nr:3270_t:CDS:2 [Entrophospora sp. SA101]
MEKLLLPKPTPLYLKKVKEASKKILKVQPKLLVLDLNGTLVYNKSKPSLLRPYLSEFLKYIFSKNNEFSVMVWSSAAPNNKIFILKKKTFTINYMENNILKNYQESEKRLFNLEQEIRKKSLFNLNNESSIEVSSSPFSNTSLKELEEEYNKIYLSKIHLSEKYIIAKQSSELLNGKIIKNSLINKKNEDIWTKDMLKLDWKLFNAPTTIQQVSNAWSRITSMNDCDFDNLLLKWYWELKKLQLKRSRLSNGATPSDILHTDNIVYDVHYNYLHYTKATSNKTLKFSTRHNGNVIHAFITREVSDYSEEDQEQLFDYQINFNYSLPRSTKIFQELIERINNPINENNDNELINGLSYDEIIIYGNSSSSHGNGDGSCNDVVDCGSSSLIIRF